MEAVETVEDSCNHSASVGSPLMKLAVEDGECHCGHAEVAHTDGPNRLSGPQRRGHSVAPVRRLILM